MRFFPRTRLAAWLRTIRRGEESRERARDRGDDEERPDLEGDVDDAPGCRQRVLDLRGDGQELHRREEERVAEVVDVALPEVALERPDEHRADRVNGNRERERDSETGDEPAMPFLPRPQAV